MPLTCIFCSKECKSSDSRPHPNTKSKDRIHNKCHLKKSLAEKQSKSVSPKDQELPLTETISDSAGCLVDKLIREHEDSKRGEQMKERMDKLLEKDHIEAVKSADNSGQFFFDLKAGIAKPHEKKKFLHHRPVREFAARYDDECFKQEALGRAYDHNGKDLNTLGESDEDSREGDNTHRNNKSKGPPCTEESRDHKKHKRKLNSRDDNDTLRKDSRVRIDEKNPCWFCFSSDSIEKHLVIAVGRHCYLTIAKGGLTDEHMLILPIKHIESINSAQMSSEIMEELERFKHSLIKYFQQQSKGVVFFERNFRSVHWQLQAVPISINDIHMSELSSKIKEISKKHHDKVDYIDIPQDCLLRDKIQPRDPYFCWQVEPVGQTFASQIIVEKGCFFPVQFGRMVLADPGIMNCPDKIDWRKCSKERSEYIKLVEAIKQNYDDFNFTND